MLSFKAASALHARSYDNQSLLKISKDAACFGCISKFPSTKVSKNGRHARCPNCDRQTVIGDTFVEGNFAIRMTLEKQHMLDIGETFDVRQDFRKNKIYAEMEFAESGEWRPMIDREV